MEKEHLQECTDLVEDGTFDYGHRYNDDVDPKHLISLLKKCDWDPMAAARLHFNVMVLLKAFSLHDDYCSSSDEDDDEDDYGNKNRRTFSFCLGLLLSSKHMFKTSCLL